MQNSSLNYHHSSNVNTCLVRSHFLLSLVRCRYSSTFSVTRFQQAILCYISSVITMHGFVSSSSLASPEHISQRADMEPRESTHLIVRSFSST